ncbi:MAG: hypothetical protein M0Q91_18070, partial [Methanoregula sp.]|nr:hypothetical protein [Methanoregula sp.]
MISPVVGLETSDIYGLYYAHIDLKSGIVPDEGFVIRKKYRKVEKTMKKIIISLIAFCLITIIATATPTADASTSAPVYGADFSTGSTSIKNVTPELKNTILTAERDVLSFNIRPAVNSTAGLS